MLLSMISLFLIVSGQSIPLERPKAENVATIHNDTLALDRIIQQQREILQKLRPDTTILP